MTWAFISIMMFFVEMIFKCVLHEWSVLADGLMRCAKDKKCLLSVRSNKSSQQRFSVNYGGNQLLCKYKLEKRKQCSRFLFNMLFSVFSFFFLRNEIFSRKKSKHKKVCIFFSGWYYRRFLNCIFKIDFPVGKLATHWQ